MKSANHTQTGTNYTPPLRGGAGVGRHYLTIALRNLRKFRLQTIVCLTGLAVGMTCFTLGTLWLRFIESFEDFVPDKENIYYVMQSNDIKAKEFGYETTIRAGQDLQDSIAAVTSHCNIIHYVHAGIGNLQNRKSFGLEGGSPISLGINRADSLFFSFFGIKAVTGSVERFSKGSVALTATAAQRLFGDKPAVGQNVLMSNNMDIAFLPDSHLTSADCESYTVTAVIPDCPHNTQFYYEAIIPYSDDTQSHNDNSACCTFVKLNPNASLDSLLAKPQKLLIATPIPGMEDAVSIICNYYRFIPLTRLRSDYPGSDVLISTGYVRWFMLIGLMVLLCSFANYLITMASHLRRRGWEMSLRRVLGSSRTGILVMVSVESLIVVLLATMLSILLTALIIPYFYEYSGIDIPVSAAAQRLCGYILTVIVCGMAASSVTAWIVMWRVAPLPASSKERAANILTRNAVITPTRGSREGSLGATIQMALSMGILFALSIMLRQVHYLLYSNDIGFRRVDMGVVYDPSEWLRTQIRQSPLVAEVFEDYGVIFPKNSNSVCSVRTQKEWCEEQQLCDPTHIDSALARCCGYQLVAGRLPIANNYAKQATYEQELQYVHMVNGKPEGVYSEAKHYPHEICVNEAFCRAQKLTPDNAIGRKYYSYDEYIISGVLRDAYTLGPIIEPSPMIYFHKDDHAVFNYSHTLLFRAIPGRTRELCDSINSWINEHEEYSAYAKNIEKTFEKYVTSEQMLIKILMAVGGCSLLVCVIGTFSLVSLSLQQRRKEIAIRKVHGAKMRDILRLFLRSHIISLFVAAAIAYPIAYIIMRHWLEGYQKQTSVDWWIVPATFITIATVVLTTISLKIRHTAHKTTINDLKTNA